MNSVSTERDALMKGMLGERLDKACCNYSEMLTTERVGVDMRMLDQSLTTHIKEPVFFHTLTS